MNALRSCAVGLLVVLPVMGGCASRTAPFDKLDDAQMTILKLQGEEVAQNPLQPQPGGIPMLPIPGLTPEQQQQLQQQLQQGAQQLQQMIPGLPPLFPQTGAQGTQQQQAARFNGFLILGQAYGDEDMKEELLDTFGDEESFNQNRGQCFTPGMAVIFTPPDGSPNVEVMLSFACNQAMGNGFAWPYPANGLAPETSMKLRNIYMRAFGAPPPPSGA
ncbi:MAG: hypothetical protein JNL21_06720 [Myxococcales bacterium]|nr:hypothetical protein [Myxococcales bacterium]